MTWRWPCNTHENPGRLYDLNMWATNWHLLNLIYKTLSAGFGSHKPVTTRPSHVQPIESITLIACTQIMVVAGCSKLNMRHYQLPRHLSVSSLTSPIAEGCPKAATNMSPSRARSPSR
eukprot:jgi/Ulvmu1/8309/UM042_0014.1